MSKRPSIDLMELTSGTATPMPEAVQRAAMPAPAPAPSPASEPNAPAAQFYRLHLLKISHGDMKATNLKIVDNQPVLLDLDSMKHHRFGLIAKHRHARDLHRFMRNWQADESLANAFKKVFKVVYVDHAPLKLAQLV